jgi:hypothetical protein
MADQQQHLQLHLKRVNLYDQKVQNDEAISVLWDSTKDYDICMAKLVIPHLPLHHNHYRHIFLTRV